MTEITYHAGYMTVNTSQEVIIIKLSDLVMKDREALKDASKYLSGINHDNKTIYRIKCPICDIKKETYDMQEAHNWGKLHRYKCHKGMSASDMPVTSIRYAQ